VPTLPAWIREQAGVVFEAGDNCERSVIGEVTTRERWMKAAFSADVPTEVTEITDATVSLPTEPYVQGKPSWWPWFLRSAGDE
jgi:hypothetical protein